MNICKDCKTPWWCEDWKECEMEALNKLEDERQSEEHQNMIDSGFYDLNQQDIIHLLTLVRDRTIKYKLAIMLRESFEL